MSIARILGWVVRWCLWSLDLVESHVWVAVDILSKAYWTDLPALLPPCISEMVPIVEAYWAALLVTIFSMVLLRQL